MSDSFVDPLQMPKEWFPDKGIVVIAYDGDSELGYAITKESYLDGTWKTEMETSLYALRLALYQYKNMTQEDKLKYYGVTAVDTAYKDQPNGTPA